MGKAPVGRSQPLSVPKKPAPGGRPHLYTFCATVSDSSKVAPAAERTLSGNISVSPHSRSARVSSSCGRQTRGQGPAGLQGHPARLVFPPCAPRYLLVVVVLLQLVLQLLRLARAALGQQLVGRQGRGGGHGQQRRGRSGAARRRKRNRGSSGAGGGAGDGAGTAPPGSAEVANRRRTVGGLGSRQRLMGKRGEAARGGSGGGSSAVSER